MQHDPETDLAQVPHKSGTDRLGNGPENEDGNHHLLFPLVLQTRHLANWR